MLTGKLLLYIENYTNKLVVGNVRPANIKSYFLAFCAKQIKLSFKKKELKCANNLKLDRQ